MRCYGSTKAPPNGVGRRRLLSPPMLTALLDRLAVKPNMYRDEMVEFLEKEFQAAIPAANIGRALRSARWTRKTARRVAEGRNADLRDYYLYKLSFYRSYQLVYIDESGCDRRVGRRRFGWAPKGVTPVQIDRFHRDQRYQILPAYTQGILHYEPFLGAQMVQSLKSSSNSCYITVKSSLLSSRPLSAVTGMRISTSSK
ncbi:uncharacterized protein FIESC28_00663 [Fusarium coffeatum]|uniref:Tc1-like transposase DDE domain-containing protein n=1 Tax=Fusarium coffeatum TaxID=231269 RepID=A0A366SD04_9HYPO|nr:uncharacterized protein FIESC28_00663 [Fusarium coffeatum]RBR26546.1 hypothetical protein FIESC28_00663 [Fusarium coffeatum]